MKRCSAMKYRKVYVAPVVEELVFASNGMLATSPNDGNGIIIGGGDDRVESDIDQLSAGRRGSWGNLWR